MSLNTRTPYLAGLLHNLAQFGNSEEYGRSDSAQGLVDYVSMPIPSLSVPSEAEGTLRFVHKGQVYLAKERNKLAQAMASKGLLTEQGRKDFETLINSGGYTRNKMNIFRYVKNTKEAKFVWLRDIEVLDAIIAGQKAGKFISVVIPTRAPSRFSPKSTYTGITLKKQTIDDKSCFYVTDKTKCHSYNDLFDIWTMVGDYLDNDETRLTNLMFSAKRYQKEVEEANNNPRFAKHANAYKVDAETIMLWIKGDYNKYRVSLEQLPLVN